MAYERVVAEILKLINQARRATDATAPTEPGVRYGRVEALNSDGTLTVAGQTVTRGVATIAPGDRVPVLRQGPKRIALPHQWRRSQPLSRVQAVAMEELLLIGGEVYIRDAQQFTALGLASALTEDGYSASRIGWGERDNTFWVFTSTGSPGPTYRWRVAVYELSRQEGTAATGALTARRLRVVDAPAFTLPDRYRSRQSITGAISFVSQAFPDNATPSGVLLTRALDVVFFATARVTWFFNEDIDPGEPDIHVQSLSQWDYAFAVSASAGEAIAWESQLTTDLRPSLEAVNGVAVVPARTGFSQLILQVLPLAWSATAAARRVAVAAAYSTASTAMSGGLIVTTTGAQTTVVRVEAWDGAPVATLFQAETFPAFFEDGVGGTSYPSPPPHHAVAILKGSPAGLLWTEEKATGIGFIVPTGVEERCHWWSPVSHRSVVLADASPVYDSGQVPSLAILWPRMVEPLTADRLYIVAQDSAGARADWETTSGSLSVALSSVWPPSGARDRVVQPAAGLLSPPIAGVAPRLTLAPMAAEPAALAPIEGAALSPLTAVRHLVGAP